jgi:Ser/Thr protein kinase RdoA (MazF antagonist)
MMHEQESAHGQTQEDLLDLDEVMQAFGITEWKNLGSVEVAPTTQLHLLVELQRKRYVLRERPEGPLGDDNTHRYTFQRYLQQAGIPIPSFYMTPQGESFVTIGEDAFELQEWVDGEIFSTSDPRSLDRVAEAGAMLGRIHQASREYKGSQYRWPSEAHIGGIVQGYLNMARSKAETCDIQAIAAALSQWADQWEAVLPSAMVSIGAGRGIPEFHIHGDYHALNLRFGSSGVSAVLGLEASRWEKRIFEVASALFYFCAVAWEPGESLTRPLVKRGLAPERARQFLHAYSEIYPAERAESALLADALMLVSPIATMNGPLEDIFYADKLDSAVIDDVMERLSWATALSSWLVRVCHSLQEMWE